MLKTIAHLVIKNARWVAIAGILYGGASAYFTVELFKNLRTNIEELLPTTARSVLDLDQVTRRLESIDNLVVLIFSNHPKESEKFVDDLVRKLEQAPKSIVASVEYRISKELEFFKSRQALYVELNDLEKIKNYIRDKIKFEKEIRNPLNLFQDQPIPEPKLNFAELRKKYTQRTSSYDRFPNGYYATPDGSKRAVLVYLPGKASSMDQVHALKNTVQTIVQSLNPKSYAPDLEVKYTGGVQETLEEHEGLIEDLLLSSIIVTILVLGALLIFYRNLLATAALGFSLFIGTFWTFGISYFLVGYLNANSAFLGSIVIGNGINYGIIYLARYIEERRRGKSYVRAAYLGITQTATSTLTASLAAGLSYGSLMLTGFRGFNQFGQIGLIGMVLCWLSAYTVLPAFLVLIESRKPLFKKGRIKTKSPIARYVAIFVAKFPKPIWTVTYILTLISIVLLFRYKPSILETNFNNLRNKQSVVSGAAYLSHFQDEIFQRYLTPLVILPKDPKDVVKIEQKLDEVARTEGKNPESPAAMIASVSSLNEFVPKHQEEKISLLKEIRHLLPERLVKRLDSVDQIRIRELLRPEAFHPIQAKDLPDLVLKKFTERDGSLGKMILVEPPLDDSTLEGPKVVRFIALLRQIADSVAPGTPVAGTLTISSDMTVAISNDGPKATVFAFIAVVLLVFFLFRQLETSLLVLFSLIIGVLWLGGTMMGFWLKINFLNFIALPITFGIGVDYGVNIFQRYKLEGRKKILTVIRSTGGAVGLCSFTTIVGYSSLLIASNQGFVSFGRLAVIGEFTCLIAAIISLPAYLVLRESKR